MNFNKIALDKNMYKIANKSFTQVLESIDPSINYKGSDLHSLDAFQRQLKRFNIKVAGAGSDVVARFFNSNESAPLFPEFISRSVKQGIEQNTILNNITASKTYIDSLDYRTIFSQSDPADMQLKAIAESSQLPSTTIKTKNNLVNLIKRGTLLESSYEAVKHQRLDLFSVALRQIGVQIANAQLKDACSVLINGDGNNNPAKVIYTSDSDKVTYSDLITLWGKFDSYQMTTLLVSPDIMAKIIQIDEFKNPQTGLNFAATGELATPLGATLFKSNAVPAGTIIALDKNCALECVSVGEIDIEYDKLIDRQMERAAITSTTGFAKIFDDAVVVMKLPTTSP